MWFGGYSDHILLGIILTDFMPLQFAVFTLR